ncbi:MAG: tyrosine-protein phosphatase [Pyrinomonadaceae bacterium]|nr:tyrosine-protein phosphatase [Phycisphaerales bacterium]
MRPSPHAIRVAVIAALALAGISLAVWFGGARWHFTPKNFGIVEDGVLYRSARLTPAATRLVHDKYAIKTIVDLGAFVPGSRQEQIAQDTADALGMTRKVFRLEGDGTGNPNAYVEALRVIADPANQPVLVHCSAGAQRTSGCVILYKNLIEHQPIDGLYDEARSFKHDPRKNPRLKPYLETWSEQIEEAYRTKGAVPGFEPVK